MKSSVHKQRLVRQTETMGAGVTAQSESRYKTWLLIFTREQSNAYKVSTDCKYICESEKERCEGNKGIKWGGVIITQAWQRGDWLNGRQGDTDRAMKKVLTQQFTCECIR